MKLLSHFICNLFAHSYTINIHDDLSVEIFFKIALTGAEAILIKQNYRTSLPGIIYTQQLLKNKHARRIHEVLRINLAIFNILRAWLQVNTVLKNLRIILIEKKLALFIHIVGYQTFNR